MLKVKWISQLCPTLCDPMDCSLPGSSLHGILQARILEWVAISFSRRSSDLGIKPESPAFQADALTSEPPGKPQECSNYHTIALISHTNKVMLKIPQARLQQYVNHEIPAVQAGLRKGRGTRDQIANICWVIEKAREFQKNICLSLCGSQLWKVLKEMGIPDHLTCLLRNLNAGQEATVRTRHGITDWFQIGKGVHQGYILSPCLFNLYAEYIMWKHKLESRLPGEISITSDMQITPPLWQKVKKN